MDVFSTELTMLHTGPVDLKNFYEFRKIEKRHIDTFPFCVHPTYVGRGSEGVTIVKPIDVI